MGLAMSANLGSSQTAQAGGSGSPYLLSVSVGIPAANGETARELYTLGVQWTQWKPGRLSADVALGTMPRLLANSVFGIGLRAGATWNLFREAREGVWLLELGVAIRR
jgi:hypothetical protein